MGNPKNTVNQLMKCWQAQDFERMRSHCVKQWHRDSATSQLQLMFGSREVVSYSVGPTRYVNNVSTINRTTVVFSNGYSGVVDVICQCEIGPQQFSVHGDWGVNVASIITTHKPQEAKDATEKQTNG